MEIKTARNESTLTVAPVGRVDTTTAPELEAKIAASLDGVTHFILELSEVSYISSAGLRVILSAQKQMNKQGSMEVTGVNADIREIFEITGFIDILTVR